MLKYANSQVVFQEFPGETTLAFNITGCPNHCPGCHSPYLWKNEGTPLDTEVLSNTISMYKDTITCVGFMGGDQNPQEIKQLSNWIKQNFPKLKTGWYSGRDFWSDDLMEGFNYVKFGSYKNELGGLDSPTTNQVMFKYIACANRWLDITHYFQTKDIEFHNLINNFETDINITIDELFDKQKSLIDLVFFKLFSKK